MNFLERIKYLGKLSFEKQFVVAVMSAERAYQEVIRVFPKGLKQRPFFRKSVDLLWKHVEGKTLITKEDVKELDDKIFLYVKDELDFEPGEAGIVHHTVITSLARNINLSLAMITDLAGEESGNISANVVEKTRHIFGTIYETPDEERLMGVKEKEWLTKSIYLVAESEEIPTNYEWFMERNPDYERGKIYKQFEDVE
jgi:hypothetical protein